MPDPLGALPDELCILCIAWAIDGQPAGPLELLLVSQRWEKLLLATPSLWSQIYIENGGDEIARVSIFLHLSKGHLLHVDVMTLLPMSDSIQLIAQNFYRVATVSIRPGSVPYLEQWKRNAAYTLTRLSNRLLPSNLKDSSSLGIILRGNNHWYYCVSLMQFTVHVAGTQQGIPIGSTRSSEAACSRMWEQHITRCVSASHLC